jgi:hypothetical protein
LTFDMSNVPGNKTNFEVINGVGQSVKRTASTINGGGLTAAR